MMKKITITLIFALLLIFPLVMNGNLYYLGGDDMRLYYLYPEKYLENYVFNLIGGNTLAGANTGYATVAYYAPMFYFIKFLKIIPLNTQFFMYGIDLAFGFLFFYKFLGLYIKNEWFIKVSSSLFYVFSPFLVITLYKHQMLAMYLVTLMPLCLYLFINAVRTNKYYFTILTALVFSIFTTTINTMPWWSAFIIAALPLLGYEFINNKANFIKQSVFLIMIFGILNFYWEYDFFKSQFYKSGVVTDADFYNSQAFLADNLRVMRGVSTLFNPLNVLTNSPSVNFKERIPFNVYFNALFITVTIASTFLVNRLKKNKKITYFLFLLSFLFSWYLFSPNFGALGPRVFLFLGRTIPMFGMYRNMFDKFGLPLAFFFASVFAICLTTISSKLPKKGSNLIASTAILLSLFNSNGFLLSRYSSNQEINRISGEFNQDFTNLIAYINNLDDKSKVLWLPLNYPTYVNIEDKKVSGHFYSGLSPLRVLTDKSDYAGGFSFITQTDFFAGDKLFSLMKNKKYQEIGELFQTRNARLVVVDRQPIPSAMQPYLYGGEKLPLLEYQDEEFMSQILGNKLVSFGSRYDLYEINKKFDSQLVYVTGSLGGKYERNNKLTFNKLDNNTYKVKIDVVEQTDNLVFLESFDSNWKIFKGDGSALKSDQKHQVVFGYANLWKLDSLVGNKGHEEQELLIKFLPATNNTVMESISLYSGFLLTVYVFVIAGINIKKKIII